MDLNTIMSNIYGENASQSFDNISISGGHIERRLARVKYLDQDAHEPNDINMKNSYNKPNKYHTLNMRMNMTGGADDDGIAVLRGGPGRDHGGLGSGEVDDDRSGTLRKHGGDIAGNQRPGSLEASEPVFGLPAFEHGGKDKIVRFFHETGDGGTHAACRTHDNDGKCHMISPGLEG